MKTQMRFQKLIYKLTLILAAVAIVYALAFCTGAIAYIGRYENMTGGEYTLIFGGSKTEEAYLFLDVLTIYDMAQLFTTILLWLGVVYILILVVCYAFANSTRRNYYKSNYITSYVLAGYAIVWAIVAIVFSVVVQLGVLGNDAWMVTFKAYAEKNDAYFFSSSTWIYIVGYIVALLSIADAVAILYNCRWKTKLMKGEKELLLNGKPAVEETAVAGEVA